MIAARNVPRVAAPERAAVYGLFVLSGFAALMLEAVFLRQLAWLFGNSTAATALVLAAFMAGLALGAWALGRVADRSARPLALFGWLECGTAVSSALLVLLLGAGREVFLAPLRGLPAGALQRGVEFGLAFGLLLVPTFLMGGTLPALSRHLIGSLGGFVGSLGRLYAANTLGAAAGVFAAGFFFFERVGVSPTAWTAVALQTAAGLAALVLGYRTAPVEAPPPESDVAPPVSTAEADVRLRRACLVAAAAGGFAVLGYEVIWTRLLSLFMRSFSYSFSLMLALFLVGLFLGSAALSALAIRVHRVDRWLGWLQVAMGVYVALTLVWLPSYLKPVGGSSFAGFLAGAAFRAAWVVLPPTVMSGMALPLAARGVAAGVRQIGRDVGRVYGANTVGAIAGSLVAGLVLLPAFGSLDGLALLAAGNAAAGVYVLASCGGSRGSVLVAAALTGACLLPLASGPERFVQGFLGAARGGDAIGELLFFDEGATTTVAVVRKRYGFHDPDAKSLITNGVAMSATTRPVWRYMALEGHLPAAMAPVGARALAVGVGTGITLGAVASNASVESITAIELSEGVIDALAQFREENDGAYATDKVRLVREDGRHFLELTDRRYDLITLEPPPPIVAGSVHLYSLDFYELCRRRLTDEGVVAQWLPLHAQSLASARMTASTFLEAFPHVSLWLPSVRDAVLIGSVTPPTLDLARLRAMYADPTTGANLERAYLETPAALLATLLLDRDGIAAWTAGAPLITDERPRMEFWRNQGGNMTDGDIATLLVPPQAGWDWVRGLAGDPDLADRVRAENRALRAYVAGIVNQDAAEGIRAATLSGATEFFLFPYGCTEEQLRYLRESAVDPARVAGHVGQCERLRGERVRGTAREAS